MSNDKTGSAIDVILCLPGQTGSVNAEITDGEGVVVAKVPASDAVVFKRGMIVAAFAGGTIRQPVLCGSDPNDAVRALTDTCTGKTPEGKPLAHVAARLRTRDVERDVTIDGALSKAIVPEHTLYLVEV